MLSSPLIGIVLLIKPSEEEEERGFIAAAGGHITPPTAAACEGRVTPQRSGELTLCSIPLFFRQSVGPDGGRAVLAVLA